MTFAKRYWGTVFILATIFNLYYNDYHKSAAETYWSVRDRFRSNPPPPNPPPPADRSPPPTYAELLRIVRGTPCAWPEDDDDDAMNKEHLQEEKKDERSEETSHSSSELREKDSISSASAYPQASRRYGRLGLPACCFNPKYLEPGAAQELKPDVKALRDWRIALKEEKEDRQREKEDRQRQKEDRKRSAFENHHRRKKLNAGTLLDAGTPKVRREFGEPAVAEKAPTLLPAIGITITEPDNMESLAHPAVPEQSGGSSEASSGAIQPPAIQDIAEVIPAPPTLQPVPVPAPTINVPSPQDQRDMELLSRLPSIVQQEILQYFVGRNGDLLYLQHESGAVSFNLATGDVWRHLPDPTPLPPSISHTHDEAKGDSSSVENARLPENGAFGAANPRPIPSTASAAFSSMPIAQSAPPQQSNPFQTTAVPSMGIQSFSKPGSSTVIAPKSQKKRPTSLRNGFARKPPAQNSAPANRVVPAENKRLTGADYKAAAITSRQKLAATQASKPSGTMDFDNDPAAPGRCRVCQKTLTADELGLGFDCCEGCEGEDQPQSGKPSSLGDEAAQKPPTQKSEPPKPARLAENNRLADARHKDEDEPQKRKRSSLGGKLAEKPPMQKSEPSKSTSSAENNRLAGADHKDEDQPQKRKRSSLLGELAQNPPAQKSVPAKPAVLAGNNKLGESGQKGLASSNPLYRPDMSLGTGADYIHHVLYVASKTCLGWLSKPMEEARTLNDESLRRMCHDLLHIQQFFQKGRQGWDLTYLPDNFFVDVELKMFSLIDEMKRLAQHTGHDWLHDKGGAPLQAIKAALAKIKAQRIKIAADYRKSQESKGFKR